MTTISLSGLSSESRDGISPIGILMAPTSDAAAISQGSRTSRMSGLSPLLRRRFNAIGSISESSGMAANFLPALPRTHSGPRIIREHLDLGKVRQQRQRHG